MHDHTQDMEQLIAEWEAAELKDLERERKQLRQTIRFLNQCDQPPYVNDIQESKKLWDYVFERPRVSGQRERRNYEWFARMVHLRSMGPCDHLAKLIYVMNWHPDHIYVVIVATHAGVTTTDFSEIYGLQHSNHRMVILRLNKSLQHLGWRFIARQVGAQNEPWGWWLEKLEK